MQTCEGLVVEETTFDQWLVSAFVAARRTAPRASSNTSRPAPRVDRAAVRRPAGARTLYWVWLAGALLALVLH